MDLKSKIEQEFRDMIKVNDNDYKKSIIAMLLRRLYYFISIAEAMIEFGPIESDKQRIDSLREELYEIERIMIREELIEIGSNK